MLHPHKHLLTVHFLPLLHPRRGCHMKEGSGGSAVVSAVRTGRDGTPEGGQTQVTRGLDQDANHGVPAPLLLNGVWRFPPPMQISSVIGLR